MNPQATFMNLLYAAMKDAALELKLTQLFAQLDPDGKGIKKIRVIVVPEEMEFAFPPPVPIKPPN